MVDAVTPTLAEADLWQALDEIADPEIPVISLVELGVIRNVVVDDTAVTVDMTPTFSGCPALAEMDRLIVEKLMALGATAVAVNHILNPPWSSDWISENGRRQLKAFGLAPPPVHGGNLNVTFFDTVVCPYCDSDDTTLSSAFGTTLCRAMYVCQSCQQPFEQFKPL